MRKFYDKFYQLLVESALRHKPFSTTRRGPKVSPGKEIVGGLSLDFSKTKNSIYIGAVSH